MMGSFIVTEVQQGVPDGGPAFAIKHQVGVSHAEFHGSKVDFGELAKRRNDLVHHFLQQHDLTTEEDAWPHRKDFRPIWIASPGPMKT